jgi:hypothetical protein
MLFVNLDFFLINFLKMMFLILYFQRSKTNSKKKRKVLGYRK